MSKFDNLPEFVGLAVYNADDGELNNDVIITGSGRIFEDYICAECGKDYEPCGKYVIQVGTEMYRL